ncbi:hypothetical protein MBUL_01387 [Methylobacterium bullatum]|uniref:Uncharacterized protein n=1 Tax=Methylobacterium bullatum TaxID=570505 RepID=A0A679IZW2_9HYPH|nr:hypothetical protein MBUL_01387 [Methylobacterium bullatum]
MAPETVTVTVTSSIGEGANLTVSDAMRQILDVFELLTAAGGKQGSDIAWQLVSVSMNSPLQVTARAVAARPEVAVREIAIREKALVAEGLSSIISGSEVPEWMTKPIRERAKQLFQRNVDRIGRTDFRLGDSSIISFEQGPARRAIALFERYERYLADKEGDLSRKEYGSIEAVILDATTFRTHPAINIREWTTGVTAKCVFTDDVSESIGKSHTWGEAWKRKRVLLSGEITYGRSGEISHIFADHIERIDPGPVKYEDVADPDYTGGLSVSDFIYAQREQERG